MTTNQLMFALFAAVIIIFSILTVTSRRILRAATFLLFVLVATGGLYFLLRYNFLAAIQLTLYAGGIVVLIIFSILLTSHIGEKLEAPGNKKDHPCLHCSCLWCRSHHCDHPPTSVPERGDQQ